MDLDPCTFSDPNGIVAYLVLNGTDPASWLCTLRSSVSLSFSLCLSFSLSLCQSVALSPLFRCFFPSLSGIPVTSSIALCISLSRAYAPSLFLCPSPLDILPLAATAAAAAAAARHPREVSIYTESRHDRIHKYVHSLALLVHSYQLSTRKHCCIVPCSVISYERCFVVSFFLSFFFLRNFFFFTNPDKLSSPSRPRERTWKI